MLWRKSHKNKDLCLSPRTSSSRPLSIFFLFPEKSQNSKSPRTCRGVFCDLVSLKYCIRAWNCSKQKSAATLRLCFGCNFSHCLMFGSSGDAVVPPSLIILFKSSSVRLKKGEEREKREILQSKMKPSCNTDAASDSSCLRRSMKSYRDGRTCLEEAF